jgi:hypothetical protein
MQHTVFISYSSHDRRTAFATCQALEERGFRCWIAPRDVRPGRPYAAEIIDGIESSRVFVVVLSANANESVHVESEVERAKNKRVPIIPFRIENVPLSKSLELFMATTHWLDAYEPPLDRHFETLAQSVGGLIDPSQTAAATRRRVPPPSPAAQRQPKGQAWKFAIVGVVALMMIVAAVSLLLVLWPEPLPPEADRLQSLVRAGNLVQGQEYVDSIQRSLPTVFYSDPFQRVVVELKQAQQTEAEFRKRANDEFRTAIDEIERKPASSADSRALEANIAELKALIVNHSSSIEPANVEDARTVLQRLEGELIDINLAKKFAAEQKHLDDAVGNSAAFRAALSKLANDYPSLPEAHDARRVAGESTFWDGIAAWNEYFQRPAFAALGGLTPRDAKKLCFDGDELLRKYPISPFDDKFRSRRSYLQHVSARTDLDDVVILKNLTRYLRDPLLSNLYAVTTKNGKVYYTRTDPRAAQRSGTAPYSINAITDARLRARPVTLSMADVARIDVAPHCALADDLRRWLSEEDLVGAPWTDTFCRALVRVKESKNVDPIIVADLFSRTLRDGARGSEAIDLAFKKHQEELPQESDLYWTWIWPDDPEGVGDRSDAELFLNSLPDVQLTARQALESENRLQSRPTWEMRWVGWLKSDGGQWEVAGMPSGLQNGELYVMAPTANAAIGGKATAVKVVTIRNGESHWDSSNRSAFVAGRPLFLKSGETNP